MSRPSPAQLARTSVVQAQVASLTTYARIPPTRSRCTVVNVSDTPSGLVVWLRPDAHAAADLVGRPVATVSLGPDGRPTVTLDGGVRRLRELDSEGRRGFLISPVVVRLDGRPVDLDEFLRSGADPWLTRAPELVRHLRAAHGADLAACLRARGCTALWAEVEAIDHDGLVLTVLDADGVHTERLDFPHPVRHVTELPFGLQALLTCSCERA